MCALPLGDVICRALKAPMMMDSQPRERTIGTPQGGVVSPVLFNLYMHFAFDSWLARNFAHIPFVRCADDGVVHCETQAQAEQIKRKLEHDFKYVGWSCIQRKQKLCTVEMETGRGFISTRALTL